MPAQLIPIETIQNKIFIFRDQKVMIDRDLAELYGVETKVLNQAVKRNFKRFPKDFMFKLNDKEKNELVTICDRFQTLKHTTSNPNVFAEHGITMLASVLNSDQAITVNIQIVRAFIEMKKVILSNEEIAKKITIIESLLLKHESDIEKHNDLLARILNHLASSQEGDKGTIGFKVDKILSIGYKHKRLRFNHDR